MSRHLSSGKFGAGLLVTPNAMHALEFLGVGEVIAATSNVSNEQLIRHFQSGNIIHRRPAGHYYKSKYGAGDFQVHRADLHNALNAAVLANDPDCVHLAHTFSGLVRSESGVTAHFVNDRVVEGDALIGCDGCRSAVRDRVYGSAPASYTGQVAFRALIPCENELEHLSTQGASMKTDEQLNLQARLGSWIDEFESNRSMTFVAKPWTPRLPLQQRAALHGF